MLPVWHKRALTLPKMANMGPTMNSTEMPTFSSAQAKFIQCLPGIHVEHHDECSKNAAACYFPDCYPYAPFLPKLNPSITSRRLHVHLMTCSRV